MTTKTCDPAILWASLTPDQQAELGQLAIATELSWLGSNEEDYFVETQAIFDSGADCAQALLSEFIQENLPGAFDAESGLPLRPDLNPLGIRQCASCACTESHACPGGCHWVAPTLCSACVRPPS